MSHFGKNGRVVLNKEATAIVDVDKMTFHLQNTGDMSFEIRQTLRQKYQVF